MFKSARGNHNILKNMSWLTAFELLVHTKLSSPFSDDNIFLHIEFGRHFLNIGYLFIVISDEL